MKFIFWTLFAFLTRAESIADAVTLTNGQRIDCKIQRVSSTTLTAEVQVAPSKTADVLSINLCDVKSVLLSEVSAESLQAEPTAENLVRLKALWAAMHPLIAKAQTQIPQTGLRLAAETVAKNAFSVTPEEALAIVRTIRVEASGKSHRIEAYAFEMRILAELGRFEEARAESLKCEDPSVPLPLRVVANLTAGICGHEEMRLFLFENPRWQEDVSVHTERSEIYERTMDAYMFAAIFSREQDEVAQAALYHAVRFLKLCGNQPEAESMATTLQRRFPESAYAKKIEDEISKASQPKPFISPQDASLRPCNP